MPQDMVSRSIVAGLVSAGMTRLGLGTPVKAILPSVLNSMVTFASPYIETEVAVALAAAATWAGVELVAKYVLPAAPPAPPLPPRGGPAVAANNAQQPGAPVPAPAPQPTWYENRTVQTVGKVAALGLSAYSRIAAVALSTLVVLSTIPPVRECLGNKCNQLGWQNHPWRDQPIAPQPQPLQPPQPPQPQGAPAADPLIALVQGYQPGRQTQLNSRDPLNKAPDFSGKVLSFQSGVSGTMASTLQVLANIPHLMEKIPTAINASLVENKLFTERGAAFISQQSQQGNRQFPEAKKTALLGLAQAFAGNQRIKADDLRGHLRDLTAGGLDDLKGLEASQKNNIYKLSVLMELAHILNIAKTRAVTSVELQLLYTAVKKWQPTVSLENPNECNPLDLLKTLAKSIDQDGEKSLTECRGLPQEDEEERSSLPSAADILVVPVGADSIPTTVEFSIKGQESKSYQAVAMMQTSSEAGKPSVAYVSKKPLFFGSDHWHLCNAQATKQTEDLGKKDNLYGVKQSTAKHKPAFLVLVPKN